MTTTKVVRQIIKSKPHAVMISHNTHIIHWLFAMGIPMANSPNSAKRK
ncbi:hypothetical protein [Ginsengibacter hankyongi]|nr:hypothetical protein [Ginsengibacter hankyongi]